MSETPRQARDPSGISSVAGLTGIVVSSLLLGSPAVGAPPEPGKFAAAVQPVTADTVVTTDAVGLNIGNDSIAVAGGKLPVYWAAPAGKQRAPLILVVQEIFGVHEHIKDICRRLAKQGYFAIAPELYFRQGNVAKLASIDEIRPIVAQVPDDQVLADLDASAEWAASHGGDLQRLGVTGFCWGGRIAWLYAAHQPKLKAAVAWYGRLGGPVDPLHQRNPADLVDQLKAPVLGLYGGQDQGIPLTDVEQMRKQLSQKRPASQIQVYPEAPHAFYADYRPSYRKAAADDGWQRLLQWFEQAGIKP